MTTLCATFLGWRLSAAPSPAVTSDAFAEAFGLLCFLHVLLFLATLRLPWLVPDAAENGFVRERPIPPEILSERHIVRKLICEE